MNGPDYSYPSDLFRRVARDVISLRLRNFRSDAKLCIENLSPPLRVFGQEYIPQHGPCVVTVNHYHRRGFGAQWIALAIAAVVPADMHWIMTGEFMYPGKWYEFLGAVGSKILLYRIAQVYDFTTMPPMPPRPKDVAARAAAVRNVLEYVRHTAAPVIGLAPEGHDPPAGVLTRPFSGLGRFASLLSRAGLRFNPVGAYEADGVFHLHFGQSYELKVSSDPAVDEKDRQASAIIMEQIARLLPVPLRGEFA